MVKIYTIAIDGDSAAGKGTLARNLAATLDFAYMDTGLLYRQIGWLMRPFAQELNEEIATFMSARIRLSDLANPELRAPDVAQLASKVAVFPAVRHALLAIQRDFAQQPPNGKAGAVLDGRDIGTVICPNADLKFYVTADPQIRAERRQKELQQQGIPATTAEVFSELRKRDTRDQNRAVAPTKRAFDAVVIDTTGKTPDASLAEALTAVYRQIPELAKK